VSDAISDAISIVTPTLNAERYLDECLASVRGQRLSNLEHVVVDGGSTDGTEFIARQSGVCWISKPELKQAAAINVGLRATTGSIVAWLNADDLYTPGSLGLVAEHFATDPALDVLCGDCDVIGENGEALWRERPGAYDFDRLLRRGNSLAQPAVFLRRRVFDRVGYLDESLDYGMDYELWLRLRGLRVAYVPHSLAAFRWHHRSKTATSNAANWRELLTIVRRHGGGWTPQLAWLFVRARLTSARLELEHVLQPAR
jgi:glycosyltransferase involved in cell wall biosynthesis